MGWPANFAATNPHVPVVAVVGDHPEAQLREAGSGQVLSQLVGHADFSFAAAWHPAGHLLATGNQVGPARAQADSCVGNWSYAEGGWPCTCKEANSATWGQRTSQCCASPVTVKAATPCLQHCVGPLLELLLGWAVPRLAAASRDPSLCSHPDAARCSAGSSPGWAPSAHGTMVMTGPARLAQPRCAGHHHAALGPEEAWLYGGHGPFLHGSAQVDTLLPRRPFVCHC